MSRRTLAVRMRKTPRVPAPGEDLDGEPDVGPSPGESGWKVVSVLKRPRLEPPDVRLEDFRQIVGAMVVRRSGRFHVMGHRISSNWIIEEAWLTRSFTWELRVGLRLPPAFKTRAQAEAVYAGWLLLGVDAYGEPV